MAPLSFFLAAQGTVNGAALSYGTSLDDRIPISSCWRPSVAQTPHRLQDHALLPSHLFAGGPSEPKPAKDPVALIITCSRPFT